MAACGAMYVSCGSEGWDVGSMRGETIIEKGG